MNAFIGLVALGLLAGCLVRIENVYREVRELRQAIERSRDG